MATCRARISSSGSTCSLSSVSVYAGARPIRSFPFIVAATRSLARLVMPPDDEMIGGTVYFVTPDVAELTWPSV